MEDLIQWLLNYSWNQGIGIEVVPYMDPDDPSVCFEQPKLIIYNENWHKTFEKPLMLAHEIGHIICGDAVCYHGNHNGKMSEECAANKFAIKLLGQYCKENDIYFESAYQFAESFGIPNKCFYLIEEALNSRVKCQSDLVF